ncbi:MAG: inositol monophosphatase family protein [Bacillota bacterium]
MSDVSASVGVAVRAAVAGYDRISALGLWCRGGVRRWRKGTRDLVTEADLESRAAVLEVIRGRYPGDLLLDEESTGEPHLPPGRVWVVDPLDGTVNFASGLPLWSVSVAAVVDGNVVAGAVAESSGVVYSAGAGLPSLRDGHPVCPSRVRVLGDAVVSVTVAPGFSPEQEARACECIRRLASRARGVRVFCSGALELCWLAEGRLDACVCVSPAFYSAAAGALVARGAGCEVLDLDGGLYRTGQSAGLVAAATPELAREVLDVLAGCSGSGGMGTGQAPAPSDIAVSEVV